MPKDTEDHPASLMLSDNQFGELRKMLESYLRITALAAIRELGDEYMERNVWLLKTAGCSQDEIAKILKSSQPVVSRILAGQSSKKRDKEASEE